MTFPDTTFVDKQTVIEADWLNAVNDVCATATTDTAGFHVNRFSGDGVNINFTLTYNASNEDYLFVYINGVYQQKNTYSYNNGTQIISFSVAPPIGTDNIEIVTASTFALDYTNASLVQYDPAGTGAVPTTVQAKLRETVSVKDFGAKGDNVNDDTAAIQAAIDYCKTANVSSLYIPEGNYRLSSQLTVTASLKLVGAGTGTNFYSTHSGNCLVFQPENAGSSNVFLSGGGVSNLTVTRIAAEKGGSAIWLRQCNGFLLQDVGANNHDFGIRISGGQLNRLVTCRSLCSAPYIGETVNASAGLLLERADIGGGNYQPCYTVTVSDWYSSSNRLQRDGILIYSVDGFSLVNSYIAYYTNSHITFRRQQTSDTITAVQITNGYFDCVDNPDGVVSGTPYSIRIYNSLGGTNQGARAIKFHNCFFGNNDGNNNQLIYVQKYVDQMIIDGCNFGTAASCAFLVSDSAAGASYGSYILNNNTFNRTNKINTNAGAVNIQNARQIILVGNEFADVGNYCVVLQGTLEGVTIVNNAKLSATEMIGGVYTADEETIQNLGNAASGTFTPSLNIGGTDVSAGSHTTQVGEYVKTNNVVYFYCDVLITSKDGLTGDVRISKLPFTADYSQPASIRAIATNVTSSGIYADTIATTKLIRLSYGNSTTSSAIPLTDSEITNAAHFSVSGFYFTSE